MALYRRGTVIRVVSGLCRSSAAFIGRSGAKTDVTPRELRQRVRALVH
jgi:hypothetical protein